MDDRDRFDRFTKRARKVLSLAQEEAQRFQHNYIGTEHLLLGLIGEGEGVAAKVLSNLGVKLNNTRSTVESVIGRGDHIVLGEIGMTPRTKKVIELAVDEARRLNHPYIGTEHLLLGLLREGGGIAIGILESLGVNLENAREQTMKVLGPGKEPPSQLEQQEPVQKASSKEEQVEGQEKQASPPLVRPTTDDHALWSAYWQTWNQPWRTEPEISAERQEELGQHCAIIPDLEKGIYPFKGMKLTRADVEWLLVLYTANWDDEKQRERKGLDMRGADLRQVDLGRLPLSRLCGGLSRHESTQEQRTEAAVLMSNARLVGAQLAGACLAGAQLTGANLMDAQLEGADLCEAQLARADLRKTQLKDANLSDARLEEATLAEAQLERANFQGAHLEGANLSSAQLEGVDFYEAHLEGANLSSTQLKEVYLNFAHLEGADLSEAHLEGADLREMRLERFSLSGAHLPGANLSFAHLEGADLSKAHLEGADLYEAKLEGADLREAYLEGADLREMRLEGINLSGARLEGANLLRAQLKGANLAEARLKGANLVGAHLEDADLRGAQLKGALLVGARLKGAILAEAQLEGANFREAQLEGVDLSRVQLEYADLQEVQLKGAKFSWAQLKGANLSRAHLEGADLHGAHLEGANLSEAHLEGAYLNFAQLEDTNLREAHLEGAHLYEAQLENANLREAQLKEASLRGTQLKGIDLSGAQLENTNLRGIILGDGQFGPQLADVQWGNTNLAVVDWSPVKRLRDEYVAWPPVTRLSDWAYEVWEHRDEKRKEKNTTGHLEKYQAAVRANRQLAVALQGQGLNEVATRFAYRANFLQRKVLWYQLLSGQKKPGQRHPQRIRRWRDKLTGIGYRLQKAGSYLFSLFLDLLAGYGYRPARTLGWYLLVVFTCAMVYFGYEYGTKLHLSLIGAIVFSITAFHGRGFFPGGFGYDDPVTILAAMEAVIGLLIELSFIATFTQRYFGK